jgi:hypothetical protein
LAHHCPTYKYWFEEVTLDEVLRVSKVLSDMLKPED